MAETVTAIVSGIRGVAIFPRVLYNSSVDVNLYFKDAAGAYKSFSGAAGYTPSLKIRKTKGYNTSNVRGTGAVDISDGVNTRTIHVINNTSTNTRFDTPTAQHGVLGGFNGAVAGDRWVFNGGDGGTGTHASAVWSGTRCRSLGTLGQANQFTILFEAESTGNQAALSFSNNTVWPPHDAQADVLRQGDATNREMVLLRIVPQASVTVSSFSQITDGWSCTIPFSSPDFIAESNTASTTVSEYQDYDVEIMVTRNADSVVMAVVTAKVRVYRKQLHLGL